MNIIVIGSASDLEECKQKFGSLHTVSHYGQELLSARDRGVVAEYAEIVFSFDSGFSSSDRLPLSAVIFTNTAIVTLAESKPRFRQASVFGFAGLRGFVNREIMEVTILSSEDFTVLENTCQKLGTSFQVVADQPGMVTPAVICMIINEAYYAANDGTASREDIDKAMKAGTNYPFGPFEWGAKIALQNVVGVLNAMRRSTGNERYQLCPLLEKEYITENKQ